MLQAKFLQFLNCPQKGRPNPTKENRMSISSVSSYASSVDYTEMRQKMSDMMAKNMPMECATRINN
jgi:hypothetical protein